MNNLNASGQVQLNQDSVQSQTLSWLLAQINEVSESEPLIAQLSSLFEIVTLKLGDRISNLYDLSRYQNQEKLDLQNFYIVCQGKIRLLS